MAAIVIAIEIAMDPAMLARCRVGRMDGTMFGSQIVVNLAMSPAIAVAVPGPMFAPMLTFLLAMKSLMLASVRIGRMKAAMLLPQVAMEAAVVAGRLVDMPLTAVLLNSLLARFASRAPVGAVGNLRTLALGALGALGMLPTFIALGMPRSASFVARLAGILRTAVVFAKIAILSHRRHRHTGRKQDTQ